jgi:hypothetical protein
MVAASIMGVHIVGSPHRVNIKQKGRPKAAL